jgi:hypothetical protein
MSVTSATGFPAPTGSQYFYCTLADAASQTTIEIVKVTAVSGTTFTIVRGQDGTTGTAFSAGAVVSLRLVAASLNDFPKLDEVNTFSQLQTFSSGLNTTGPVQVSGSAGTSGQVLTSSGSGSPTWTTPAAGTVTSVTGTAPIASTGGATPAISISQATTSTNGYLSSTDWNTFNNKVSSQWTTTGSNIYYNTGSIGIGTSSPASGYELVVNSSAATTQSAITADSGYSSVFSIAGNGTTLGSTSFDFIQSATTADAYIYNRSSANMIFGTANTERMRVDANGYLLIGNTSNISNSRVGIHYNGASLNGAIATYNSDTGAGGQYAVVFNRNATYVGSIQTTNAATSYTTASDYRLKENVTPMQNALDKVKALKPVTYNWKSDGSHGQGFIAHELQEIVPDCVFGEKDAVNEDGSIKAQGIDTSFLVATLTAAIQELNAKVELQAAQIAALEAK